MSRLYSLLGRFLDRGLSYWLPILLLCIAVAARLAIPEFLDRLSLIAFDIYQREAPRQAAEGSPIRIVDIDDASLKQVGQWPWPRSIVAELLDKLREAGAAVVVFDVLFSEPDRISPKLLLPLLTGGGAAEEDVKRLLAVMPDSDQRLADAMAKMPVVIGFALTEAGGVAPPIAKAGFAFTGAAGADPLRYVPGFPEAIGDLPILQQAAAGNGFVNPHLDWDNILRRVPMVMRLGDKPWPSLAGEALRLGVGARSYIGRAAGASSEKSFGENTGLNALKIGPLTVPTDGAGMVWLHYATTDPARFIPAADILNGKFDAARIADNIVLIGASAKGLNDLHATPLAPDTPGTEIHAQLIEQVLQQSFLSRPDWMLGAEVLFTFVAGLLLIVVMPRIGAMLSAGIGAVMVAGAVAASWYGFLNAQLLIDPVYPILVSGVVYGLATLLNHRATEQRQREIRQAFSRYMSPVMVAELAKHPEKLKLGGEIKIITIMFCDIRGFTTLSEGLSAQDLAKVINGFLTPMTEIIGAHKGTIDKYIGDCIMAFWNAPIELAGHARHACAAALAMQKALAEWNASGGSTVKTGIGLNTGHCSVGNMGSDQRFDYTVLGDEVNLASRLEGQCKVFETDIITGEKTRTDAADFAFLELDLIRVHGRNAPSKIFALLGGPEMRTNPVFEKLSARQAAFLTAYRKGAFKEAEKIAEECKSQLAPHLHLEGLYNLYLARLKKLQENPPAGWQGVWEASGK